MQLIGRRLIAAQKDHGCFEPAGESGVGLDFTHRLSIHEHALDPQRTVAVGHDTAGRVSARMLTHTRQRGGTAPQTHTAVATPPRTPGTAALITPVSKCRISASLGSV